MPSSLALDAAGTATLSGRTVRRIGFGAMQLPGPGVLGPARDRDQALAVLRRAVELGVNHIDTAQYYGPDVANELIHDRAPPLPRRSGDRVQGRCGATTPRAAGWRRSGPRSCGPGSRTTCAASAIEQLGAVNLRLLDERRPTRPRPSRWRTNSRSWSRYATRARSPASASRRHSQPAQRRHRGGRRHLRAERVQPARPQQRRSPRPLRSRQASPSSRTFRSARRSPASPRWSTHPVVQEIADRHDASPAQVGLAWLLARARRTSSSSRAPRRSRISRRTSLLPRSSSQTTISTG